MKDSGGLRDADALVREIYQHMENAEGPLPEPVELPSTVTDLIRRLEENRTPYVGLPIKGRGSFVRRVFRKLFKPFAKDALDRQAEYNRILFETFSELLSRYQALVQRLRDLEARISELENKNKQDS